MDRFRDKIAGVAALAGGLGPWLVLGVLSKWLPQWGILFPIGLLGSGPLFVLARVRYRRGPRFPKWQMAADASAVGAFAALAFLMAFAKGMSGI
jgi:hypothetical protein